MVQEEESEVEVEEDARCTKVKTPPLPPGRARRGLKFMTYFTTDAALKLQTLAVN